MHKNDAYENLMGDILSRSVDKFITTDKVFADGQVPGFISYMAGMSSDDYTTVSKKVDVDTLPQPAVSPDADPAAPVADIPGIEPEKTTIDEKQPEQKSEEPRFKQVENPSPTMPVSPKRKLDLGHNSAGDEITPEMAGIKNA